MTRSQLAEKTKKMFFNNLIDVIGIVKWSTDNNGFKWFLSGISLLYKVLLLTLLIRDSRIGNDFMTKANSFVSF